MSDQKKAETLSPGATFGRYAIVRIIGSGGMGAVYEAMHTDLKKRVAIKIVHPEYASHDEIQARFMREGESASRIRHPHVVDVTDFGIQNGIPFLVMEYLEGESLSEKIKRDGALTAERLADIMLPVCAGVGAAHDEGVIHRDLKPDNIFLARTRGGEVPKVVDFGISKVTDDRPGGSNLTSTGAMLGTPSYMSPEQMRTSKQIDSRTDQYALGVIMYECVIGEKPFVAETLYEIMNKIVHGEYPPMLEKRPELSEAFARVVMRAMHHEMPERFASVRDLGRALIPFASERQKLLWQVEFGEVTGAHPAVMASHSETPPPLAGAQRVITGKSSAVPQSTMANTGREIDAMRTSSAPRRAPKALLGAGVLAVLAIGALGWRLTRAPEPAPRVAQAAAAPMAAVERYTASIDVTPSNAHIQLDGEAVGVGNFAGSFLRNGTSHMMRLTAEGYRERTISFRDAPPTRAVTLEAIPAAVAPEVVAAEAATRPAQPVNGGRHAGRERAGHAAANGSAAAPAAAAPAARPAQAVGTNGAAILQ